MDYAQPMLIDYAQPLLSNENIDWVVVVGVAALPLDSNWRIMGTFTQQCFNGATHACFSRSSTQISCTDISFNSNTSFTHDIVD